MRSFHRYASDAMVLAMVLHLVRHYVFDHYRSFRWFSWVSGVILLWLTYITGINGYMLPWDGTAQFVTIATAEWLDWLPVFNGRADAQLHHARGDQRPAVLAAVVPAHRSAAGRAGAAVGAHAARPAARRRRRRVRCGSA